MAFEQGVIFTALCHTHCDKGMGIAIWSKGLAHSVALSDKQEVPRTYSITRIPSGLYIRDKQEVLRSRRYWGPILLHRSPRDSRYGANSNYTEGDSLVHLINKLLDTFVCIPSCLPAMATSPYEWNILEWDEKNPNKHTNKQTKVADKEKKETGQLTDCFKIQNLQCYR